MTEHVSFRADLDLVEAVEQYAADADVSVSEAWRSLARRGLIESDTAADHLEGAATRQHVEEIKQATYPQQRRAWFRSNVGGRLLTCFNSGLRPDSAEMDLSGYRREADELHDDADLVAFVAEGLAAYREAYDSGRKTLLVNWVKHRASLPADYSPTEDDPDDDVAEDAEPVEDAEQDDDDPTADEYRAAVEDSAELARSSIVPVEEQTPPRRFESIDATTWRDDVETLLNDGSDDLRGIELLNDDAESQT